MYSAKSWTTQDKIASLPTGAVTLAIGSLKFGSKKTKKNFTVKTSARYYSLIIEKKEKNCFESDTMIFIIRYLIKYRLKIDLDRDDRVVNRTWEIRGGKSLLNYFWNGRKSCGEPV